MSFSELGRSLVLKGNAEEKRRTLCLRDFLRVFAAPGSP
jgi:hypothetical protein